MYVCDTAIQRLYPNSLKRSTTMKWETWSWNCDGAVQNLHQRARWSSHKSDMNNPKKSGSAGNATRNLNCEVFIRGKVCLMELWVEGTVVQNLTHVISRVNAWRSWAWLYANDDSNFHRTRQCIRSLYLNNQIASRRDWKTLRRVSNYSALSKSRSYKKSEGENWPFICSMLLALGERAAFAATLNPYVSENSRTLCHQILLRWQLEPTIDLIGNNPFQPSEHRNTSHVNGAGDIRKMLITCIAFIRS